MGMEAITGNPNQDTRPARERNQSSDSITQVQQETI